MGDPADNLILAAFAVAPILLSLAFVRVARRRQSVALGNVTLFLALVFVVMFAGEVYCRFVRDTTDAFALTRASRLWFRRHYRFNEAGYRDSVELSLERPDGKRRITFIGDSFTAGHGIANVEDRFANRIRRARPDWDVNVLAANGFDTGNELHLVREALGRRLELDQVVLVYCLNDISDIVPDWRPTLRRIFRRPPRVIDHSYFLNLLYFRYRQARDPDIRRYYSSVADAYRGPIWERQQARLRELASAVHAGGGELRVVTFPFLHALGPGSEYVAIHGQLDEFWRTLGVPHLDLLSTYASQASSEMAVSREDAHPNARAHAMAADAIAPFIAANLE